MNKSLKTHEDTEKIHKNHRKKKDKHVQKLQYKKNKKKIKAELKEQKKRAAEKELKNSPECTIERIIKKLLKYNSDTEAELEEVFRMIDNGDEIDISELDDKYIKHKMNKLFKLLKIPRASRTKKFIYKKGMLSNEGNERFGRLSTEEKQIPSFCQHIHNIITKIELCNKSESKNGDDSESNSKGSDAEDSGEDAHTNREKISNTIFEDYEKKLDRFNTENKKKAVGIGPLPKPESQSEETLQSSEAHDSNPRTENIRKPNVGGQKREVKSVSESLGESIETLFSDKKKETSGGKSTQSSKCKYYGASLAPQYSEEQLAERDQIKKQFQIQFDQVYRPKTLLQEHQVYTFIPTQFLFPILESPFCRKEWLNRKMSLLRIGKEEGIKWKSI
jgi:hypothetical protein